MNNDFFFFKLWCFLIKFIRLLSYPSISLFSRNPFKLGHKTSACHNFIDNEKIKIKIKKRKEDGEKCQFGSSNHPRVRLSQKDPKI